MQAVGIDLGTTNTVLAAKYRDLCLAHGLPDGDVEVHAGDDRWIGRVDVFYRDARLLVELDSRRWHNTRDGFESDRRRTNDLVLAGWRVLRITWRMIHDHPERVVAMIAQAGAARGERVERPHTRRCQALKARRLPGVGHSHVMSFWVAEVVM